MAMMVHGDTSSSPFGHGGVYDVFLSFRGKDTRKSFTGFLYDALRKRRYNVFIDDEELRRGEEISPALLRAIEVSRIAILVFSENYASSTWCLDELVQILRCKQTRGQLVWPVFYNVDPSEVRHQRAGFGIAMAKHEARFKDNIEKLQTWKRALFEAASLSGWSLDNGYEFKLIETIVEQVSSKLDRTLLYISDYMVGLETRILQVRSLLHIGPGEDIRMVGIHGLGGIGKTTIAKALFNSIAYQFDFACFLADVRENSSRQNGLARLQEALLYDLVGEKNIKLRNINRGISIIKNRLRGKKVLLILDDISTLQQLQALAGGHDWFGFGSIIIITTRNGHLLSAHGVENIYQVKGLNHYESLELFSWNAFRRKAPDTDYTEISNFMVLHAMGLPLALKVLGSILFGKTVTEWVSLACEYKTIPHRSIWDVLRISFDTLEYNEKEIFLDIACFFKGETMEYVEKLLEASLLFPKYGICVLIDRSLIYVDEHNRVRMHDLIQDMGKEIVRLESPIDPGKRSRLWYHQEVLEVLSEKSKASYWIKGMLVDLPEQYMVRLRKDTFQKMKNLRVLMIRNAQFYGSPQRIPNSLRLLEWRDYASSLTPSRKVVLLNPSRNHFSLPEPLEKKILPRLSNSPFWNHGLVSCTGNNTTQIGTLKCGGILLYKERMNICHVSVINSDLHCSNLSYEEVDGALDIHIYKEEEEEEEEEEDNDDDDDHNDSDDLDIKAFSTSINPQVPESYESETKSKEKRVSVCSNAEEVLVKGWRFYKLAVRIGLFLLILLAFFLGLADDKSNKLILRSSSHATTVHENEKKLELQKEGKLKEDINTVQVQASTCTASTSIDRDKCVNGAERTQIQFTEKRASEEFTQIEINMEAFYASIEAESSSLPLLQDSMNTRPSEETQKKLQSLRDLILKNFSILLHPEQSGHVKNVLDYLLSLSPEGGISLRMRSAMLQLSTSFSQWSLDYNNANLKIESATEILSSVEKLQKGLETNVKEFKEVETLENVLCSELANLEARRRELEEQINAMKAEIADFKLARDDAVQKKRKIFEAARMIRAEQDDLANKVPQLRAEQQWARLIQANIESEWSKLVQQFIESSSFCDQI